MAGQGGRRRPPGGNARLTRGAFLKTAAAAGVGGLLLPRIAVASGSRPAPKAPVSDLHVALVGGGSQGRTLLVDALKIPGIRFRAVCDIWPYHRAYAVNILKQYDQEARGYADLGELLAKTKDLDAVLIATPDWVHAAQTIACLKAGRHVYCEKEMAHTIEDCKRMVRTARATGKLLQIGHQRRSNPRYLHALKLHREEKVLGRVTHAYGQWNRARALDLGWPKKHALDGATLARHGYGTMERFRNWRWYRKFSGGPMADLGSHQVDILAWFIGSPPVSVQAVGSNGYYPGREWWDSVMAVYEFRTINGPVTAFYQVLNTTSHGGYYETIMGDGGSVQISEDPRVGFFFREDQGTKKDWEDDAAAVTKMGRKAIELKVGETRHAERFVARVFGRGAEEEKPPHQPHLENFFDAVRGKASLTCPAAKALVSAVTVLRTNEAVATGRRVAFAPGDFTA